MNATDELRRMLDERGIRWHEAGGMTFFGASDYGTFYAASEPECGITLDPLTPEQAIAVTVGHGTCHDTRETPLGFVCSECGSVTSGFWPCYCPWCGRRVVG